MGRSRSALGPNRVLTRAAANNGGARRTRARFGVRARFYLAKRGAGGRALQLPVTSARSQRRKASEEKGKLAKQEERGRI